MPHMEREHEIPGLRFWDGNPTVRLIEADDDLGDVRPCCHGSVGRLEGRRFDEVRARNRAIGIVNLAPRSGETNFLLPTGDVARTGLAAQLERRQDRIPLIAWI